MNLHLKKITIAITMVLQPLLAAADEPELIHEQLKFIDDTTLEPGVSPIRRIERQRRDDEPRLRPPVSFRSFDGSDNNRNHPAWGQAGGQLARWMDSDYGDALDDLSGLDRPSARAISNAVNSQTVSMPNTRGASDFLWQWGQFIDHDIDLTDGADPAEPENILVPTGDESFDPTSYGDVEMSFNRSIYDPETGISTPRQQLNEISNWLDASNVYGSDVARAEALRTLDGTGRLKMSEGDLLPYNTDGLANAGGSGSNLFLAGDVRANEQIGLTTMHTLFVREHNRLADKIAVKHLEMSGDNIYYRARRMVAAQIQIITYREYLPLLLGRDAIQPYRGYKETVNGSISNIFSAALYRYGHSALSPQLLRLDAAGNEIEQGHLSLRNAFFSPNILVDEGGIDPILRGLASQTCQQVDVFIIDDVRNFLFGPPGAGGFDLAALNIQRGRDHGLPSYNDTREALGLPRAVDFSDITQSIEMQNRLSSVYENVDQVDTWVGGLAEDHLPGALVGELVFRGLKRQFQVLRDGDRFWYQRVLSSVELDEIETTRLSDVIRRNTAIGSEIADNVFIVPRPPQAKDGRPRRQRF